MSWCDLWTAALVVWPDRQDTGAAADVPAAVAVPLAGVLRADDAQPVEYVHADGGGRGRPGPGLAKGGAARDLAVSAGSHRPRLYPAQCLRAPRLQKR